MPLEIGYAGTELRRRSVEAVLRGEKTTTSGLAEEEEPVHAGQRLALLDFDDEPIAIVEVLEARILPAGELDLPFVRDEGEGFESLEEWREAHERFFQRSIPDETLIDAIRIRVVERL